MDFCPLECQIRSMDSRDPPYLSPETETAILRSLEISEAQARSGQGVPMETVLAEIDEAISKAGMRVKQEIGFKR